MFEFGFTYGRYEGCYTRLERGHAAWYRGWVRSMSALLFIIVVNFTFSKSPISVAAAGIYMVSQLSTTKRTQKGALFI